MYKPSQSEDKELHVRAGRVSFVSPRRIDTSVKKHMMTFPSPRCETRPWSENTTRIVVCLRVWVASG
jgi:hypothetical protein